MWITGCAVKLRYAMLIWIPVCGHIIQSLRAFCRANCEHELQVNIRTSTYADGRTVDCARKTFQRHIGNARFDSTDRCARRRCFDKLCFQPKLNINRVSFEQWSQLQFCSRFQFWIHVGTFICVLVLDANERILASFYFRNCVQELYYFRENGRRTDMRGTFFLTWKYNIRSFASNTFGGNFTYPVHSWH